MFASQHNRVENHYLQQNSVSSSSSSSFFFFFFLLSLQGHTCSIWSFPGQGANWSCCYRPTPQPQQHRIQNSSATYTTAHGNAGSLTHRVRPGIEPTSSWILVGFVSAAPQWELLILFLWPSNISLGMCVFLTSLSSHQLLGTWVAFTSQLL